jgi:arsenite methyltransferase
MDTNISRHDRDQIEAGIREKYAKVAETPEGGFNYPTGRKGLEALGYDKALIDRLPDAVAAAYCGVGNPFSQGTIEKGDHVLDVGCGAGVDAILAGMMAGPEGSVVGVDLVSEMIVRAESNLRKSEPENVRFRNAAGENLPFADGAFDVVISNGAINLIPDKRKTMAEIFRVLLPGGRLLVADQVAAGPVEKDLQARLSSWFR